MSILDPRVTEPSSLAAGSGRNPATVFLGLAALFVATSATLLAIVATSDGNDYGRATQVKHRRLASMGHPSVVLVGGSNLAYGFESDLVEQRLQRGVANMGMDGYLGVRFMLEEVKPHLETGDIVVLAFEHDSYFKSVDGTSADHLMVVKARPGLFWSLSWPQRGRLLGMLPYAAQQKILRVMRDSVGQVRELVLRMLSRPSDEVSAPAAEALERILAIESVAGFDSQGDLNSHIGVDWSFEREDGLDASALPIDGEVIPLLANFSREMRERGVIPVLSYTPVIDSYYQRHQTSLDELHRRLLGVDGLVVPSPPSAFALSETFFFDTVYHLNGEGRHLRSERVVNDLEVLIGGQSNVAVGPLSPNHHD